MNEVISKVPSYSRVAALDSPFTAKIYGVIDETTEHRREMPFGGHSVYFGESDILASIEVMERRSCASLDDGQKNKRVFASYNELGPLIAMNPISVGLYSKDFYQKHPDLMFSANKKIHWVEGLSLFSNRKVLVPELLAYLSSDSPQERYIYSTSNGTATGSNLQEAMLFGLLEVIERDAFLVSWYSGEQWKKISLDESPILGKDEKCLIRRMNHFGYRTHFLDITNEFCVPAVAAIAERIDHQYGYLCFGAAAHPLLSGAIRSALSEIASDIDVANKRSRLFEPKIIKMLDDFNYVQTQQDHTDLYAHPASTKLIQERLENTELVVCKEGSNKSRQLLNSTLLLGNYVEKLHHAGYETIAIDETTPAQKYWGLNSVKIIVPGLVPIDFGWDKQRALSNPRVLVRERLQRNISATKKFKPIPHPFP
jgi:ribosomal protein S12 methylthiotransferase accessory factor